MQGVDVHIPQRIRKAASLSFVMGTNFCGLEERKLKWGEFLWQKAGIYRPLQFYPLERTFEGTFTMHWLD